VLVTADDFIRAESDAVFTGLVAQRGFGNSYHDRELTRVAIQSSSTTSPLRKLTTARSQLGSASATVGLPTAG